LYLTDEELGFGKAGGKLASFQVKEKSHIDHKRKKKL
jgi:hypothetical protein